MGTAGVAAGDQLFGFESLIGSSFDDTLTGSEAGSTLEGLGGSDGLVGLDGDDNLFGGEGDDLLIGNGGKDSLKGGGGTDQLIGGAGADNFYLHLNEGRDTVVDFEEPPTEDAPHDSFVIFSSEFGFGDTLDAIEVVTDVETPGYFGPQLCKILCRSAIWTACCRVARKSRHASGVSLSG